MKPTHHINILKLSSPMVTCHERGLAYVLHIIKHIHLSGTCCCYLYRRSPGKASTSVSQRCQTSVPYRCSVVTHFTERRSSVLAVACLNTVVIHLLAWIPFKTLVCSSLDQGMSILGSV